MSQSSITSRLENWDESRPLTREEAVEILGNIAKIFKEYLNNEGLAAVDDHHQCFSISFRRHGIPSHLFEMQMTDIIIS